MTVICQQNRKKRRTLDSTGKVRQEGANGGPETPVKALKAPGGSVGTRQIRPVGAETGSATDRQAGPPPAGPTSTTPAWINFAGMDEIDHSCTFRPKWAKLIHARGAQPPPRSAVSVARTETGDVPGAESPRRPGRTLRTDPHDRAMSHLAIDLRHNLWSQPTQLGGPGG
jgi:hypothetical protein